MVEGKLREFAFEALKSGLLEFAKNYNIFREGERMGDTKFDYFLSNGLEHCHVLVWEADRVKEDVGIFAVMDEKKYIDDLWEIMDIHDNWMRGIVLLFVKGADVKSVKFDEKENPRFFEALKKAYLGGIEFFGFSYEEGEAGLKLVGEVKVDFGFDKNIKYAFED